MNAFARTLVSVLAACLAQAAWGQQLFTFVEQEGPVGVQSASAVGDDMGPVAGIPDGIPIEVDVDLLRSNPTWLAVPDLAGNVATVYRRKFEDRGDGNAMWSGARADSEVQTFVFTVHGNMVIGYGSSGQNWTLVADSGRGRIQEDFHLHVDEVVLGGEEDGRVVNTESLPPSPMAQTQSTSTAGDPVVIDVLILKGTRWIHDFPDWQNRGDGIIRSLFDYGNMVLANSGLDFRLNPAAIVDSTWEVDGYDIDEIGVVTIFKEAEADVKNHLFALRYQYDADIVHFVTSNYWRGGYQGIGGLGRIWTKGKLAQEAYYTAYSWTEVAAAIVDLPCRRPWDLLWCVKNVDFGEKPGGIGLLKEIFIHEIGHNLGGQHNREQAHMPEDVAFTPSSYGYLSSPRVSLGGQIVQVEPSVENPGGYTVMAYRPKGPACRLDHRSAACTEERKKWTPLPHFSQPVAKLIDGTWYHLGEEGEHDMVATLREVAPMAARLSDYNRPLSLWPKDLAVSNLAAEQDGTYSFTLTWTDQADDETHFSIEAHEVDRVPLADADYRVHLQGKTTDDWYKHVEKDGWRMRIPDGDHIGSSTCLNGFWPWICWESTAGETMTADLRIHNALPESLVYLTLRAHNSGGPTMSYPIVFGLPTPPTPPEPPNLITMWAEEVQDPVDGSIGLFLSFMATAPDDATDYGYKLLDDGDLDMNSGWIELKPHSRSFEQIHFAKVNVGQNLTLTLGSRNSEGLAGWGDPTPFEVPVPLTAPTLTRIWTERGQDPSTGEDARLLSFSGIAPDDATHFGYAIDDGYGETDYGFSLVSGAFEVRKTGYALTAGQTVTLRLASRDQVGDEVWGDPHVYTVPSN